MKRLIAAGVFCVLLLYGFAWTLRDSHAAVAVGTGAEATFGVVERLVTVPNTGAVVTLVPEGTRGFFIQPQTINVTLRIGIGKNSMVNNTTQGIILNYSEALAEQVQTSTRFHEVKAASTGDTGYVWVVYYLP